MTAVAFSDILGCGLGLGLEVHGLGLEGHDLGLGVVALLTSLQFYTQRMLYLLDFIAREVMRRRQIAFSPQHYSSSV